MQFDFLSQNVLLLSILFLSQAINDANDPDNFHSFDFLVLVLIYQVVPARRSGIKSLLKNVVRLGLSAEELLSKVFDNHFAVSFDSCGFACL